MHQGIRVLVLMMIAFVLEGCGGLVGLAVGAAGRAAGTGDTYSAWKQTMPTIPANQGRVFLYLAERGGGGLYTIEWGTGAEVPFLEDSNICDILGKTFMYSDLPAGDHVISTDDVREYWSDLSGHYRKGKYNLKVSVAPGSVNFVRIAHINQDGFHIVPQLVDRSTAEAEMNDLSLDTHFVSFKCHPAKVDERGS